MKQNISVIQKIIESNVLKRIILSNILLLMLHVVLKIKLAVITLIFFIRLLAILEILRLAEIKNICPEVNFFPFAIVPVGDILILYYGRIEITPFIDTFIQKNALFIAFMLYLIAFISFIMKLRKRNLKNAFKMFSIANMILFFLTVPVFESIKLIKNYGRFWWCFSVLLVISNDIFAYIFGKLFGKTPLIRLSPKKTVEGFLGAMIATSIAGIIMLFLKQRYNILYDVSEAVNFNDTFFGIPLIYLHGCVIIFCANFIAPFGGFFASAFKRLLKIKDFSALIPGHGGVLDRMDCQITMAMCTRIYIKTFVVGQKKSIKVFANMIAQKYNKKEICEIITVLMKKIKE